MSNWYDPVLAVLVTGALIFVFTLSLALAIDDVRRWWEDAGVPLMGVTILGMLIAAPLGRAFAQTPEEREQARVRSTIGVKIADHPDGGEVWRVENGSQSSVYFKPKGKQ